VILKIRNLQFLEYMGNTSKLELAYIRERPMLMAKLGLPGERGRYFELLIDSGADHTLISRSDAMIFGLDYDKLTTKEMELEAANQTKILARKVTLQITLNDEDLLIPVFISKVEVQPLLGRKGVFDRYDVIFKEREQKVIFKKI